MCSGFPVGARVAVKVAEPDYWEGDLMRCVDGRKGTVIGVRGTRATETHDVPHSSYVVRFDAPFEWRAAPYAVWDLYLDDLVRAD